MTNLPDSVQTIKRQSLLIVNCYYELIRKPLFEGLNECSESFAEDLFFAPVAIVSHGIEVDPIFNYGNALALDLFEMSWNEFINMPSRMSAEPINQKERELLLSKVSKSGFIDNYQGIRVSKNGTRFLIQNATIWNLFDQSNRHLGQAAKFNEWVKL